MQILEASKRAGRYETQFHVLFLIAIVTAANLAIPFIGKKVITNKVDSKHWTLYFYSDFLQVDFDYSICTDTFQVYLKSLAVFFFYPCT